MNIHNLYDKIFDTIGMASLKKFSIYRHHLVSNKSIHYQTLMMKPKYVKFLINQSLIVNGWLKCFHLLLEIIKYLFNL